MTEPMANDRTEPPRDEDDRMIGPTVLEFGTGWMSAASPAPPHPPPLPLFGEIAVAVSCRMCSRLGDTGKQIMARKMRLGGRYRYIRSR